MVALSHSFAILLASSFVLAKFAHPHVGHHHEAASKRSAIARRALRGPGSKRAVCHKKVDGTSTSTSSPSAVTSAAGSDSNSDTNSSNNSDSQDDKPSKSSSPGVKGSSKPSGGKWWSATSSSNDKTIIAHFIVGNAYSYTPSQWASEIKMAAAQGIDAFALNLGYDSWQAGQVQSAYDVAAENGFKMVLSFDMTVLGCGDSNVVRSNVNKYSNHPAQLKDNGGKAIVTTFDGGHCKSSDEWKNELDGARFVPAFFNDLNYVTLKGLYPVVGGDLLWGGAWPKFNEPISWSEDSFRISHNGLNRGAGDLYITTVSPWFFTHYGSKNFIWHNDDHLWNNRWEDLVEHRNQIDAVEIVSWNDYGESTYIGPIGKDQPGSEAWVNGFDHRAFLEMTGYYASAFKSGSWPSITSDKIFIYGRPHGANDQASSDPLPRPDRSDWVTDKLWIVLFSTGSGSLTVTQGSSSSTTQVKAGVNKISMPLGVASSVTAVLTRYGEQVFEFAAPISFGHSPKTFNFNMNAAAGPLRISVHGKSSSNVTQVHVNHKLTAGIPTTMASFSQTRGLQRESDAGIKTFYIPPDVWLAITEAIRLQELAVYQKRNEVTSGSSLWTKYEDTSGRPPWTKYAILNSNDLLRLSSVCRHFRQALFPVALERLHVYPIETGGKARRTILVGNTARISQILEPEGAGHKELVREFAYHSRPVRSIQKHTLMKLPPWVRVLELLTNVRRLHLTNVDIHVEDLLGLTELRHLKLQNCKFRDRFPADGPPYPPRLHLQSLQLLNTLSDFVGSEDRVLLDFFVSPALTHLMVDKVTFMLVPWTSCTALHELVLTMSGGLTEPEEMITVLESCISLKVLYLEGVCLQKEHAVRLRRLDRLQTVTCDEEMVEYLVPGRPVEHLRLHCDNGPFERRGHNWNTILEAARNSMLPIKTLAMIDFQGYDPQYTLQALDQLVETFGTLEELGLFVEEEQDVIDAIPLVARLESLRKIRIDPDSALLLVPWQEARLQDLVRLSRSKHLREVDFGHGSTWRWVELKAWVYCGSKGASKQIDLQ